MVGGGGAFLDVMKQNRGCISRGSTTWTLCFAERVLLQENVVWIPLSVHVNGTAHFFHLQRSSINTARTGRFIFKPLHLLGVITIN